jgi:hypothetical protein
MIPHMPTPDPIPVRTTLSASTLLLIKSIRTETQNLLGHPPSKQKNIYGYFWKAQKNPCSIYHMIKYMQGLVMPSPPMQTVRFS